MSIEAMKRALEYLQENEGCIADVSSSQYVKEYYEFMERFAGVIKQAEKQEPVAWSDPSEPDARYAFSWSGTGRQHSHIQPLYTAPPPRKPLSDEEIKDILLGIDPETKRLPPGFHNFARAIEAAHNIVENT